MTRGIRVICILAAITCGAPVVARTPVIHVCLAELCVAGNRVTERVVVKKLGPGERVQRPDDVGPSRCYVGAATGTWADFTFARDAETSLEGGLRGIMLTEQKLCGGRKGEPRAALGRRLAGATIGMSESDVLASRGHPTRIDGAEERQARSLAFASTRYATQFGDRVYVYDEPDDQGFTFIYFRDGRVRTIWFSTSE